MTMRTPDTARTGAEKAALVLLASLIQIGWIACQVAFIGYQGFLQPLILGLGLATLLAGVAWKNP